MKIMCMTIGKQQKQKIDVQTDTISSALLKKVNNESLSQKTLNKLVKIANTRECFTPAEAKNIFINNEKVKTSIDSMCLARELRKVVDDFSNAKVKSKVAEFIINCNSPTIGQVKIRAPECMSGKVKSPSADAPVEIRTSGKVNPSSTDVFLNLYADRIGQTIGEGGQAVVIEDKVNANKVMKIFFDKVNSDEIDNQITSFKRFYGENSAQLVSERVIYMDKIEGVPLSEVTSFPAGSSANFESLIETMIRKGCPPSDMSENNFLYDEVKNKFSPVDITRCDVNDIDINGFEYVLNKINNNTVY